MLATLSTALTAAGLLFVIDTLKVVDTDVNLKFIIAYLLLSGKTGFEEIFF